MNYDTTSPAAAEPNSSTETFSTSLGDDSFVSLPEEESLPRYTCTVGNLAAIMFGESGWMNIFANDFGSQRLFIVGTNLDSLIL